MRTKQLAKEYAKLLRRVDTAPVTPLGLSDLLKGVERVLAEFPQMSVPNLGLDGEGALSLHVSYNRCSLQAFFYSSNDSVIYIARQQPVGGSVEMTEAFGEEADAPDFWAFLRDELKSFVDQEAGEGVPTPSPVGTHDYKTAREIKKIASNDSIPVG